MDLTNTNKTDNKQEAEVVLNVRNLRKSFGGNCVLHNTNLNLVAGEIVLLHGPNGAGKTTLLNILTGNLEADTGEIDLQINGSFESFHFPFSLWSRLNPNNHFLPEKVSSKGVGRTWQNTRLFPKLSLTENITVASHNHPGESLFNVLFRRKHVREFENKMKQCAINRLVNIQLGQKTNSNGNSISLGQSKRVAIAQAVQAGAKILFFDEPLSGLDKYGIETVLETLKVLANEHRISIVIVEHILNIKYLLHLVDTFWKLIDGKLTASKQYDESEISIQKNKDERWLSLFSGINHISTLSLINGATLDIYRRFDNKDNEQPIFSVKGLTVCRNNKLIIGSSNEKDAKGVNFSLKRGDIAVLKAPNGWGKTTLMEALSGLISLQTGNVVFKDKDLNKLYPWHRAKLGIGFVPSEKNTFLSITSKEVYHMIPGINESSLNKNLSTQAIETYSGGQRQKLALMTTIKNKNFQFLLLDEPFSMLDNQTITDIVQELHMDISRTIFISIPSTN